MSVISVFVKSYGQLNLIVIDYINIIACKLRDLIKIIPVLGNIRMQYAKW